MPKNLLVNRSQSPLNLNKSHDSATKLSMHESHDPVIPNMNLRCMQNNSAIQHSRRGKNNPQHMFVLPQFTRDPKKRLLQRVIADSQEQFEASPGSYDVRHYKSITSKELDEKLLQRAMSNKYNAYAFYKKNEFWIEKGRRTYMVQPRKTKDAQGDHREFLLEYGLEW